MRDPVDRNAPSAVVPDGPGRTSPATGCSTATYDRIGIGYSAVRQPDPRLHALIGRALTGARTVVNVGAGAGSYEPPEAEVTAVDPSEVMLAQHRGTARVKAVAEALPFADGTFEAAMAVMTVHHWSDPRQGLAELRRVARRQAVFTWDPAHPTVLWLIEEYLPQIRDLELAGFPSLAEVADALGAHTVLPFPVPHDFTDGFQNAFWRRPESFLDPAVRMASSTFARLPDSVVAPAIARLESDLTSGAWRRRHADLLGRRSMDYGYRLLVGGR